MKTKITKIMLAIGLFLPSTTVFGGVESKEILFPIHCTPMSHNPKCWDSAHYTEPPRPNICKDKSSCEVIAMVTRGNGGNFFCTTSAGFSFSCTGIVKELGTLDLNGLSVEVLIPHFDACHLLGACGPRSCLPGLGYAKLNHSCL